MKSLVRALVLVVVATLAGTLLAGPGTAQPQPPVPRRDVRAAAPVAASRALPLRGVVIALDPGHQLGNHRFPRRINAPVPAGGFTKPCNTTGAATNAGTPEATVNWLLARAVQARLRALGASVPMTRKTNSEKRWGPCVDVRGRFGKRVHARLMVSLHADGAAASAHGFHVIAPTRRRPWTTDIAGASLALARRLRTGLVQGGFTRSTYVGDHSGLVVRSDLGTLNMSDVPVAMIEIGNMRNAHDARLMTSAAGRAAYARAVVRGVRAYLRR